MEEGKQRITVVAAGDFPTHPRAVQAIADATFVVCCDSAYLPFASLRPRPAADFVVVGDGDNDMDILAVAGLPVAMGNALDEVKAIARVVTDDCDHDGAAHAIEKYMLDQKNR